MSTSNAICETERISVNNNATYRLSTAFVSTTSEEYNEKAIVVAFRFYDQAGEAVEAKVDGLHLSRKYGYFLYANFSNGNDQRISEEQLRFPQPVAYVQLTAVPWNSVGEIAYKTAPGLVIERKKYLFDKLCLCESGYIAVQASAAYQISFIGQVCTESKVSVSKAFVVVFRFFDSQLQLCAKVSSSLACSSQLGEYMYANLSPSGRMAALKSFCTPDTANYVKLAIIPWNFTENTHELRTPELMLMLEEGSISVCGEEIYTVSYTYITDFPDNLVFHSSAYTSQGDLLDVSVLNPVSASFPGSEDLEEPGVSGGGRNVLHLALPPEAVRLEYSLSWRGSGPVPHVSDLHIVQEMSLLRPGKTDIKSKIFPYFGYQIDLPCYSSGPALALEMAFQFSSPTGKCPIGPNNFRHDETVRIVHDVFSYTAFVSVPLHENTDAPPLRLFILPPPATSELIVTVNNNTTHAIYHKIIITEVELLEERLDTIEDIHSILLNENNPNHIDLLNKLLTYMVKRYLLHEDKMGLRSLIDVCHKKGLLTSAGIAARALLSLPVPDMPGARKARAILGELQELRVGWLPDLGKPVIPDKVPSSPVRIAHFFKTTVPFEYTGGAIRCANIVKFQKEAGLEPLVVTPLGYPEQGYTGDIFHMYEQNDVPHYQVTPISLQDARAVPADKAIWADAILTYDLLRDKNISLIQSSSGYRGYELALKGLAVARKLGIPFVYEVRSFHEHTWTTAEEWVLDAERTRMRMQQENACMLKADAVVTICDTMRQELIKRGVPEEKITIVPNSVDSKIFYPRAPDIELQTALGLSGKKVVGYISNVSKREGHEVLLRAVALLRREHEDICCLIVGEGPQLEALKALATELEISDCTVFTGSVPHESIVEYYAIIDIFVVPRIPDYASDYVTPMKPIEAMAMQKPIIASDRLALQELLADSRGLLFTAGDHRRLADQIGILLADESLCKDMAENGYNWVLSSRTWDKTIEIYSALYNSILHRHGRAFS